MGLVALVGTQLGQTCPGWRSPMVPFTGVASAAGLFAVVETPGVSQLFGCTPLGPMAWTIAIVASLIGTMAAAVAEQGLARA